LISSEAHSELQRIECSAFSGCGLKSITIPGKGEMLCSSCFADCLVLSSISFQRESQLMEIRSRSFEAPI
jgi:hypothetical protein